MNIAVIRFSSLGDIVLTSPAVRLLAAKFPSASITYITTPYYSELARLIAGVSQVESIKKHPESFKNKLEQLKNRKWDLVADLQGSYRSGVVRRKLNPGKYVTDAPPRFRRSILILFKKRLGEFYDVPTRQINCLKDWGVEDDGRGLELLQNDDLKSEVENKWPVLLKNPFVLIPGAKHETKKWPGENWNRLFGTLVKKAPVVILGSEAEMPAELKEFGKDNGLFDLTGKTSIPEMLEILRMSRCVVSGDTGPMHLAVAAKRPLVAFFGPTVREFGFYPFRSDSAMIIERNLWCRPCSAHGREKCPLGHFKCLKQISAEEVAEAVMSFAEN